MITITINNTWGQLTYHPPLPYSSDSLNPLAQPFNLEIGSFGYTPFLW